MRNENKKHILIFCIVGILPIAWLGLLTAPYVSGGLLEIIENLTAILNNPLKITWCEDSLAAIFFFIAVYGLCIGIYYATKRNTRPREEHGSAKWGDTAAVDKKYRERDFENNKILTKNVRIGLDGKKHRRNLNTLVVGGSGAGKTRFYAKPNVMQANSSMVILDPKGGATRS